MYTFQDTFFVELPNVNSCLEVATIVFCRDQLVCFFLMNVCLKELNRLLVGDTSHLGVVLRERDGSDSPNN